jgi:ATP-dependent Lhr-like helicase
MDLAWRVAGYDPAKLDAMWRSGEIVAGRFVGGRVRFVAKADAALLHAVRGEGRLGEREKAILDLIGAVPGIGLDDIVRRTRLDKEVAREAVYTLDRGMFVARAAGSSAGRNLYVRYEPPGSAPSDAMQRVIERYVRSWGPATARKLERLLRIERISLDATLSALAAAGKVEQFAVSGEPELYFAAPEDMARLGSAAPDGAVRLLSLLDPYAQHFSRELEARWGEGWYYPVFKGARPCGIVELWEMSGRLEVRNVELEPSVSMQEVLAALDRLSPYYDALHIDTTTVAGAHGKLVEDLGADELAPFYVSGFVKSHTWLAKGIDTERVLTFDEFVSLILWRQGLTNQTRFASLSELDESLCGLRSEEEACARLASPRRGMSFKALPGICAGFGVPNVMMWFTPDTARLYRDALQEPETETEASVIGAIRRSGGLGRKALIDGLLGGSGGREVLTGMLRKCMVVRNSFGRYLAVPGPVGDRSAARRRIVEVTARNFAVVSPESISAYTNGEIGAPEARAHLHALRKGGVLAKGFLLGEDSSPPWMPHSIPYWMPADFASKPLPRVEGDILIGPGWKDRVCHYLRPWVQHRFGLGSAHLVFSSGSLVGAYTGKRVGGSVHVKRFGGSEDAWQIARKQAAIQGWRLVNGVDGAEAAPEADDDDIDEWAKKLWLTTVRQR